MPATWLPRMVTRASRRLLSLRTLSREWLIAGLRAHAMAGTVVKKPSQSSGI
jgi:hypothetical protein